jgi:hypothetical protein
MPMAAIAAAITFVIAFVMRFHKDRPLLLQLLLPLWFLVVFYSDHLAGTRPRIGSETMNVGKRIKK